MITKILCRNCLSCTDKGIATDPILQYFNIGTDKLQPFL